MTMKEEPRRNLPVIDLISVLDYGVQLACSRRQLHPYEPSSWAVNAGCPLIRSGIYAYLQIRKVQAEYDVIEKRGILRKVRL